MPKVQAYTYRNQIIPVAEATEKTVFQCPWTRRIFEKKSQYIKHLQSYRTSHIHRKFSSRKLENLWMQPTFPDIINWIESNPTFLFDNSYEEDRKHRDQFKIKITYLSLTHYYLTSNSHSCPHDGVTNWGRRDKFPDGTPKPTGYPGWSGHIEYQLSHSLSGWGDLFKPARIHTGTGGGVSNKRYGFSVTFFDSDWPSLTAYRSLTEDMSDSFKYGTPNYFK